MNHIIFGQCPLWRVEAFPPKRPVVYKHFFGRVSEGGDNPFVPSYKAPLELFFYTLPAWEFNRWGLVFSETGFLLSTPFLKLYKRPS